MAARKSSLEAELEAITREFVARIISTLRNASFAEVASLSPTLERPRISIPRPKRSAPALSAPEEPARARRPRQGADKRAELREHIVQALRQSGSPMGVRALSSQLHVAPDLLAVPLKELRAEGRVAKHGDKRNTTYSVA